MKIQFSHSMTRSSKLYYEVFLERADTKITVYVPQGPDDNRAQYYGDLVKAVMAENRRHAERGAYTWKMTDGRPALRRIPKQDATHLTYDDFRGAYF